MVRLASGIQGNLGKCHFKEEASQVWSTYLIYKVDYNNLNCVEIEKKKPVNPN